jgi:hypothetical protein
MQISIKPLLAHVDGLWHGDLAVRFDDILKLLPGAPSGEDCRKENEHDLRED